MLNSTDGGQTWQKHPGVPTGLDLNAVAFYARRPAGLGGRQHRHHTSHDQRRPVLKLAEGTTAFANLHSVAFAPDGLRVWAAGDNFTLLTSTDGGRAWQVINAGDGSAAAVNINSIAFASDGLRGWFVGPEGTIMRTVDGGYFWWFIARETSQGESSTRSASQPTASISGLRANTAPLCARRHPPRT